MSSNNFKINNEENKKSGMTRFSQGFSSFCNKWVPSAMVFVMILTIFVAILSVVVCDAPMFISSATFRPSCVLAMCRGSR